MIKIDVPGFGHLQLEHLVTDYTGTLSEDGRLLDGVKGQLAELAKSLNLHVLTSDTFGTARAELSGIECTLEILTGEDHDIQKETYVRKLGAESVVALGNGRNDTRMLRLAVLGIAVCQAEGCATSALTESDIVVTSATVGLSLLTDPRRILATLRV